MKKNNNFLDYIPAISNKVTWSQKDDIVTVNMYHKGFYAFIAHKFFKRPSVSHIKLDKYGSFIWQQIDGKNTVNDLAISMKEKFGDKAEPLYDRLVTYIRILRNNKFIVYNKEK